MCEPAVDAPVYRPDDEIVPVILLPPAIPSTAHVTLELDTPLMEAWSCALCPGVTDACTGTIETVVLGAVPVPVSVTVCMVDGALSANVIYPARLPVAEGEKVTWTLQLAAAASEVPQLLVCA